ncbi:MAG: PAS domain-containing sensor histidine kinase, partial [Bryobacterales bacterium]|nr:PAS domain-containing sensor histidine kinase [Bryobacterales bacterium]
MKRLIDAIARRVNTHEFRVLTLTMLAGLPAVVTALGLLWLQDHTSKVRGTLTLLVLLFWIGFSLGVRERVASPLRTLANLLEAMREGDYSIRARHARGQTDALAEVMQQVNAMAATLRAQRLGALEATTLLRKVMEEIDVAVFAFDENRKLRLVNRAGERLLAQPVERLMGLGAENLGLTDCLEGDTSQTVQRAFPAGVGRWGITRASFREGGLPHQLLVITDLTRALREEELQAWQRIVR